MRIAAFNEYTLLGDSGRKGAKMKKPPFRTSECLAPRFFSHVKVKQVHELMQRGPEQWPDPILLRLAQDRPGGRPNSSTCGHLKIPHP
jgi:hypothetical protein